MHLVKLNQAGGFEQNKLVKIVPWLGLSHKLLYFTNTYVLACYLNGQQCRTLFLNHLKEKTI